MVQRRPQAANCRSGAVAIGTRDLGGWPVVVAVVCLLQPLAPPLQASVAPSIWELSIYLAVCLLAAGSCSGERIVTKRRDACRCGGRNSSHPLECLQQQQQNHKRRRWRPRRSEVRAQCASLCFVTATNIPRPSLCSLFSLHPFLSISRRTRRRCSCWCAFSTFATVSTAAKQRLFTP